MEAVIPLTQILVSPARWPLVGEWLAFLQAQQAAGRPLSVSKDSWNMLLELMDTVPDRSKLAAYDLSPAWPAVFDDFMDFTRKRK